MRRKHSLLAYIFTLVFSSLDSQLSVLSIAMPQLNICSHCNKWFSNSQNLLGPVYSLVDWISSSLKSGATKPADGSGLLARQNIEIAHDVNIPTYFQYNEETELQVSEIGMLGFCSGMSPSERQPLLGILGRQRGQTEVVWTCPEEGRWISG